MPKVSDINAINITLEINDRQSLFILLAGDGSINRLGTGAVDNADNDLLIGTTKEPLFKKLISHLDEEMLAHMGGYDISEKKGALCKLSIGFSFANADANGFVFCYGSESQGPPDEINQFVIAAVELTNPWFQKQKKMMSKSDKSSKPWWRFW